MNVRRGLRHLVFVLTAAVVTVVGSERMYWFWETSPVEHLAQAAFYALPVAGLLWVIARFQVGDPWALLAATPLYGYVVEGVITPVLYEGGPLVPVFPAYFAFWHGLVAVAVLIFGVRHLLLQRSRWRLAGIAGALGLLWGTWATTLRLPESLEDPELLAENPVLHVLDPGEFLVYTLTFTAVLAVGHLLLGWTWMSDFQPARATKVLYGVVVATGAIGWTFAVPWALPMFAAYVGLHLWVLNRHRRSAVGPSLLATLSGRVAPSSLLPLLVLPATAAIIYAGLWWLDPDDDLIQGLFMDSAVAVHALIGFVVTIVALIKTARSKKPIDTLNTVASG